MIMSIMIAIEWILLGEGICSIINLGLTAVGVPILTPEIFPLLKEAM
jgi:hypothetical protein